MWKICHRNQPPHSNWSVMASYVISVLPVRVRMMNTENISGYSARMPGAFIDMCCRQKCSICFPISSSNVALQALATLDVPEKVLQIE